MDQERDCQRAALTVDRPATHNQNRARLLNVIQPDVSTTEAAFFDSFVAEKGQFNPFGDRGWETLARRFAEFVDRQKPFDLLDIGCGTGQSRRIYINHCRRYLGVDLSSGAIAVAQREFPDSEFQVADATALPFPENSFDLVAFSSVLHHIPDYGLALREAYRVLRPGGQVFAYDPNLLHPAMALIRWPRSPLYSAQGVSPNERPLLPSRLARSFRDCGFSELFQRSQADIPYRYVAPKLINACLGLYNAADWLMARLQLDRIFGTFVITAGRKPFEAMPATPPTPLRYSVVVPVYNEHEVIAEFCAKAIQTLPENYELLICHDMDEDTTLAAVDAIPAEEKPPNIRFVRNRMGKGVRFAIEAGMRAAQAPVVVVMMADVSDDFAKVDEMVRRCEQGADVVCASRYMKGGEQRGGPFFKGMLSRGAGVSLHLLCGLPTHDPTNSFKAYRRDFLMKTPIESSAGFALGIELTVKAHFGGGRVEEVPALWLDRTAGQSRFRLMKWLPLYLKWYFWAFRKRWFGGA